MLVLSIYYRNIWENMYDPFIVPISGHDTHSDLGISGGNKMLTIDAAGYF